MDEDFADVAEGVAGLVEECDHFDACDGFGVEEALAAFGEGGGFGDADHEVVVELLDGDACGLGGLCEAYGFIGLVIGFGGHGGYFGVWCGFFGD